MKQANRFILAGIIAISFFVLHLFIPKDLLTLEHMQLYASTVREYVHEHYILAVCVYLLFFVCATIAAVPVTVMLTVIGGYLFGTFAGACWAMVGAVLGSVIIYLLVRYLVGEWIQQRYQRELNGINQEIARHGTIYLLIAQLLPFTPTPLINIAAGLSQISWVQFAGATTFGILPGTLLYTWAGSKLHVLRSIDDVTWIGAVVGIGVLVLVLLGYLVRKWWL